MLAQRCLKSPLGLALGLLAAIAGGSPAAARPLLAAWTESGPHLATPEEDWRTSAMPAMRLGLHADRWNADETPPSGPNRAERCKKWRAVADSLSETFAGHTLRKTIVRRNCELFGPEEPSTARWDWPWNALERGRVVPPRPYRTFGAWTIRCGIGPTRRRCALVHEIGAPSPASALSPASPPTRGITTHFVIDRVAGREVLLWRLFVPSEERTMSADVAGLSGIVPSAHPQKTATHLSDAIRFKLGPARPWESFPVCSSSGCWMEVSAERAGEAATQLADGHPVRLELRHVGGAAVPVILAPRGFAQALAELIRLRRVERKPESRK